MKIVFATHNQGKLAELRRLLAEVHTLAQKQRREVSPLPAAVGEKPEDPSPLALYTAKELGLSEVEESGSSFAENAALKAEAAMQACGLWALADDSGLEVDALEGRPGVHSARYAGPGATDAERWAKLLEELKAVPEAQRGARFRCTIALAIPEQATRFFSGSCEGHILHAPAGEGGFGYDPVFFCQALGKSFAAASAREKNAVSHRGQAVRACAAALAELL